MGAICYPGALLKRGELFILSAFDTDGGVVFFLFGCGCQKDGSLLGHLPFLGEPSPNRASCLIMVQECVLFFLFLFLRGTRICTPPALLFEPFGKRGDLIFLSSGVVGRREAKAVVVGL